MDSDRLYELARELWTSENRRRLLRRLAVFPLAWGLAALIGTVDESAAKRNGHHRRKQNHRRFRRRKKNRKRNDGAPGAGATCRSLDQLCSLVVGPSCCAGTTGTQTVVPLVTTCQSSCSTTQECQDRFPGMDVECVVDLAACPFHPGGCCRPKKCTPERSMYHGTTYLNSRDSKTCTHAHGVCCGFNGAAGVHNCCFPGQICLSGSGFVDNDPDLIELHANGRAANTCPSCAEATGKTCCGNGAKFGCCSADNFCVGSQCRS